jgi:hypothetical protein
MSKEPLFFTFYIAAPLEKVWEGSIRVNARLMAAC